MTHSWAPNFGFKLWPRHLLGTKREMINLSSVQTLMNAGEQVTPEVCDAFLAATGLSPSVLQPAFGMAEVRRAHHGMRPPRIQTSSKPLSPVHPLPSSGTENHVSSTGLYLHDL